MNQLAIVIPYYKIDYFEETLKSVASQSCTDFTVYIGNDASKDDPQELVEKYLGHLSYFYLDYEENLGGKNLALQWERILDLVKEEWFQILGDDDTIAKNFVEKFYESLKLAKENNCSVIKYSHNIVDENNKIIHEITSDRKVIPSTELFEKKYKGMMPSSLSENIFLKSEHLKHRFLKIPFAWGADDFAILSFSNAGNVVYISDSKVNVRLSSASISGDLSLQSKKDFGYHLMREKALNLYSQFFNKSFVIRMLNDHLNYCEKNNVEPHLNLFKILLLRKYPKRFLDMSMRVLKIKNKTRKNNL